MTPLRVAALVVALATYSCGDPSPDARPSSESDSQATGFFAEGRDPIAGEWALEIEPSEHGPILRLHGGEDPASILIHPMGSRALGDWLLASRAGDAMLLVQLADPAAAEASLRFEDGTRIEGTLHPMPSDVIGDATVIVAGFRGELSVEGQVLDPDGYVVAFDGDGSELERRPLVGD